MCTVPGDKQLTASGAVGVHTAYATFSFDSSEGAEYAGL
jgi:hypothetical protein